MQYMWHLVKVNWFNENGQNAWPKHVAVSYSK